MTLRAVASVDVSAETAADLRALADAVEAGQCGAVGCAVVIVLADGAIGDPHVVGPRSLSNIQLIGVLEAAKTVHLLEALGGDE